MKIIDFSGSRCKHCYKCVRNCDVKAIDVKDSQAVIAQDRCILCGHCLSICPQDAKSLHSDLPKVRDFLNQGEKVVLILAPSYRSLLRSFTPGQFVDGLKKLGFFMVQESSEGAAYVTEEMVALLHENQMDNIITTDCPSAVSLIEKYYPDLIPYLAPLVSPMIAQGRLVKKLYGPKVRTVFVGPCIARKGEAEDPRHSDAIDAVLDYPEILQLAGAKKLLFRECESLPFDNEDAGVNSLYPIAGGILTAVEETYAARFHEKDSYEHFYVDGMENCREFCESLRRGDLHHCFVELNLCRGSCIKGPMLRGRGGSRFKQQLDYVHSISRMPVDLSYFKFSFDKRNALTFSLRGEEDLPLSLELKKTFEDQSCAAPVPTLEQIQQILARTGKHTRADELNCGACGYASCREKAVAEFRGRAEKSMCIAYMHEQAATLSNLVMETSPNIVLIVDHDLKILEYSAVGEKYFGKTRSQVLNTPLEDLFDPTDLQLVRDTHIPIHGKKRAFPQYNLIVLENIVYLPSENSVLATLIDITEAERQAQIEYEKKLETINMTQKVIEKQMKVAQEIAGLLGETTAETKVSLTNIGKILLNDSDFIRERSSLPSRIASGPKDVLSQEGAKKDDHR